MEDQVRAAKVAKLEELRNEANRLGGPLGTLLARSFDLMTTVVRDVTTDQKSLEYILLSFSNERELAERMDAERHNALRYVLYGLSEGIGMMGEAVLQERKRGGEERTGPSPAPRTTMTTDVHRPTTSSTRADSMRKDVQKEVKKEPQDTWTNEASPDCSVGREETLNFSFSTRSNSTMITREEQPRPTHQPAMHNATRASMSSNQAPSNVQIQPNTPAIPTMMDFYNGNVEEFNDSVDAAPAAAAAPTPTTHAAVAARAAVASFPIPQATLAPLPAVEWQARAVSTATPAAAAHTTRSSAPSPPAAPAASSAAAAGYAAVKAEPVDEPPVEEEQPAAQEEEEIQCNLCFEEKGLEVDLKSRDALMEHLKSEHGIDVDAEADEEEEQQEMEVIDISDDDDVEAPATPAAAAAEAATPEGGKSRKDKKRKRKAYEEDGAFNADAARIKKKKKKEPAPRPRRSCTIGLSFKLDDNEEDEQLEKQERDRHQCPQCEMTYSSSSVLKAHLRDKHGVLPYECGSCEMKYARKAELVEHLRKENHVEKGYEEEEEEEETKDEETIEEKEEEKKEENEKEKVDENMAENKENENNDEGNKNNQENYEPVHYC